MIIRNGLFQAQFETNNQFAGYRDKEEAMIAAILYYDPGYFKPYYVIFTDYKVKMVQEGLVKTLIHWKKL